MPALPEFNCVGQYLGDQIGEIVRAVLQTNIADAARAEQVRCIQHQQPQIAYRDTPDVALCVLWRVRDMLRDQNYHQL